MEWLFIGKKTIKGFDMNDFKNTPEYKQVSEQMSEENKYYTPDISEFHVGFQFEKLYFEGKLMIHPSNKSEWIKIKLSFEDLIDGSFSETENDIKDKDVRVKYLDKEDIESFGFISLPKESGYTDGAYKFNNYYMYHNNSLGKTMQIETRFLNQSIQIFYGTIKNKSELKILLKQLNII